MGVMDREIVLNDIVENNSNDTVNIYPFSRMRSFLGVDNYES